MTEPDPSFHAVVLAGERPGGSALARALALPAAVMVPLAGKPCLERVLDTLAAAGPIRGVTVCGPAADVVTAMPELSRLLGRDGVHWLAPESGPAASAGAAAQLLDRYPLLLTSGDHGLLGAEVVEAFCRRARAERHRADLVVGLVPFERVREAFPESRRTVLGFADQAFCGSNLFALLGPGCRRALDFWRSMEGDRKRPWKMAARLGWWTLLQYGLQRLTVDRAFEVLSTRAGCRIEWVTVPSARAAVDVDSLDDWRLADRLLTTEPGNGTPADGAVRYPG